MGNLTIRNLGYDRVIDALKAQAEGGHTMRSGFTPKTEVRYLSMTLRVDRPRPSMAKGLLGRRALRRTAIAPHESVGAGMPRRRTSVRSCCAKTVER